MIPYGCFFLLAAAVLPHGNPGAGAEAPGMGPRERVLSIATKLLGTTEATGKNDGPVIESILASTGNRRGEPYCAAFNYYCYQQAGVGDRVPRSAWSPDWVSKPTWTQARGGPAPQPADSFGIYFPSKGRVAHTGLVRTWGEKVLTTIEANTSPEAAPGTAADRDGGGIWSKRRLVKQIFATKNWIDKP
jgi:hypothetical protein